MTDVSLLGVLVVFFALAVVFVRGCERLVGPDVEADRAADEPETEQRAA